MARILVVNDDARALEETRRKVRAAGHEALVAGDSRTALRIADTERPDALLVDANLNHIDGRPLARHVRAESWGRGLPIIGMSDGALHADDSGSIDAGYDELLIGQYDAEKLRSVLGRFFQDSAVATPANDAPPPTRSLGRVLVVDDEPTNVELLRRRLVAIGCEVLTASSASEAMDTAFREPCDLILLDVMMPGMDGWQCCRALKSDSRTANVPVIFVTARDRPEDVARGFEVGGIDYVPKPFDPTEFVARVRSAIVTKRLQDDMRAKNDELERLERSRQELVGMLGHDIRNLASSVVAFLHLVGEGQLTAGQPEFTQLLRLSQANVGELLRMVNSLLDVYRIEEGGLKAAPREVSLAELCRRSVAQMTPEATAREVALTLDVSDDIRVYVDDALIIRVFTNLISNGVKHSPSGGTVQIEAMRPSGENDDVIVRVSDCGPGVAREDAPHVFDRFYQGSGRGRGGHGLGLAFCKLAVELHGGWIRVANGGSAGAVIELTLPVASAAAVAVTA
jgi:two-component system sensor histidine kinase/response regulator